MPVRQARGLVGPGGDVVFAAHHDVAIHADGVGTSALRTAFAGAGDGPVLFLHDDVTLDRSTVRALARAWERTGDTTVPWTRAAGALAAHEDTCRANLPRPEGPTDARCSSRRSCA